MVRLWKARGGKTILYEVYLVEDDIDIREATLEFLEMEGIKALGCANGREALTHLKASLHQLPSLLLVDLNMPVLDGIGFREEQLRDPALSQIPCVILSADGKIDAKCEQLKIEQNLRKPIDLDDLMIVIQKFVRPAESM